MYQKHVQSPALIACIIIAQNNIILHYSPVFTDIMSKVSLRHLSPIVSITKQMSGWSNGIKFSSFQYRLRIRHLIEITRAVEVLLRWASWRFNFVWVRFPLITYHYLSPEFYSIKVIPSVSLFNFFTVRYNVYHLDVLRTKVAWSWAMAGTTLRHGNVLWSITVKPVYNDHLMGYFSAFWSSSRWPRAT